MTTTYGSFPGVRIEVAGGAITAVAVGSDENLVLFGGANYANEGSLQSDGTEDGLASGLDDGSINQPEQINARSEADSKFGEGSELADGMREALANGVNIDFLYGVAPQRVNAVESGTGQTGTLPNAPIWEDDDEDGSKPNINVVDTGGTDPDIRFTYDGTPTSPTTGDEQVNINPLTGEFAFDDAASTQYDIEYKYLDWESAFKDKSVRTETVEEDETGVFTPLSDSDSVSLTLQDALFDDSTNPNVDLRSSYQLVNVVTAAEPNDNEEVLDSSGNFKRNDARYDTSTYDTANNSIDEDYFFKLAPVREKDQAKTVLGGVGGLFAGNPVSDPIYNDELLGYDSLEQSFTKTDADNMRNEEVIPIRQNGSIRVKDNLSTSTETDWERDFWRRRIADRVILIGKTVGDQILGRINDEKTRASAERLITAEIRQLVNDGLLRPNSGGDDNWFVDVYPSSTDDNKVKIDIGFTPFGIVKRIDETITVNTN